MACYDVFKDRLVLIGLWEGPLLHVASSILAGFCAAALSNPVDVIKTRLQASSAGKYKGVFDCIKSTVRDEGMWALNGGLSATCTRMVPYVTVMLFTNETLKKLFAQSE